MVEVCRGEGVAMARSPLDKVRVRPKTLGEARLILLRERDTSLTEIARSLGVTLSIVSRVNKGTRRSQMIEREIARRLMLTHQETFPESHGKQWKPGRRKRGVRGDD